jgi:hypothetical protein
MLLNNLWFPSILASTAIERDGNCVFVQNMFAANVRVHREGMQTCRHAEMHVGLPVRNS